MVLGGFRLPDLMDAPYNATTLSEFWSKRWNSVIQSLLRNYVYDPMRKKLGFDPKIAAATTFFSSGLLHVLPVYAGLGNDMAAGAMMMSYFLVQFICVSIEKDILRVDKWNSTLLAKVWTAFCLFAPSYLLTAPVFKLSGYQINDLSFSYISE